MESSEQHVELGICATDYADCAVFLDWLHQRNPFGYEDECLHSLSFGLISDENDGINCEKAEEIGKAIKEKLDNLKILECTIKRKDQVKPIIALQNTVKVDKESIPVEPTVLFNRLVAIAQREQEDVVKLFKFELTQEPMSLFKHGLMRKPDKSSLRKAIMKDNEALKKDHLPANSFFVVDGGALLHRVRWMKKLTVEKVAEAYFHYVRKHYNTCIFFFDGYECWYPTESKWTISKILQRRR